MTKNEELFFDEEARRLIDCFALCFKINIRIFSSGMDELLAGFREPNFCFCRQIHRGPQSCSLCCRREPMIWEYREPEFESMIYTCYTGFAEAVMPVKLRGVLLGYALLGRFRTKSEIDERILRRWIGAGRDPENLRTTFGNQTFFDKNAMENMLRLFSMLLSFLLTREYVKIRRPGLAESVSHWLESHISESLDLNRIASVMNRSRSTISHTIKRQFGMSFKELCILKRIQHFERIISGNPDISIREAAALAGYRDPFYFSRIYKKVRFSAPSAYLKSQRKKEAPGSLVV
jgi:AraC-like DNA-binding protein